MTKFGSDRQEEFRRGLWTVALPVALQNLLSASVNFLDSLMIGQLGDTAIAGLGIANQVFFLMLFVIFGINNGGSILVAQFWGKNDVSNLRRVVGLCLFLGVIASALFTLVAFFIPAQVIGFFSKDVAVISLGADYLRVVGLSYIATAIAFAFAIQLRSVERATTPMVISFISIAVNCIGNYALIFGTWGFPRLGVVGAALSTCIARYLECFLLVSVTYLRRYPLAGAFRDLFSWSGELLGRYFGRSVPVICQEFSWALGITLYQVVYARIGTAALAAVNIVSTVERFVFVAFVGLGSAAGVMIGKSIGEEQEDKALWIGRQYVRLSLVVAVGFGIVILMLRNWVLHFYHISPEVTRLASGMFVILTFFLWMKAGNMLLISGVFRSGGDTRFAFALDTVGIWLVGLPLGLWMAFVMHANPLWVYLIIGVEEVTKLSVAVWRFKSRKWMNNLVKGL